MKVFSHQQAIVIGFVFFVAFGYFILIYQHYPKIGDPGKDIFFEPSNRLMTQAMIDIANPGHFDYLVDLGSGDGRLVIEAARRGAKALGVEYNPKLVEFSKLAAKQAKVEDRATFLRADIFKYDFSEATIITLFLGPELNLKLRPRLLEMRPGTRIVSNFWPLGNWEPDKIKILKDETNVQTNVVRLWIVPANIHGFWKHENAILYLDQEFQKVIGIMTINEQEEEVWGRLEGNKLFLESSTIKYEGLVNEDTLTLSSEEGQSLVFFHVSE